MPTLVKDKAKTSLPEKNISPLGLLSSGFFIAFFLYLFINILLLKWWTPTTKDASSLRQIVQADNPLDLQTKPRHAWSWWLTRHYLTQKNPPDVVVFGSSQMGCAHACTDAQFLFTIIDTVTHRNIVFLERELENRLNDSSNKETEPSKKDLHVLSLANPGEMISDAYMISKALFPTYGKPKLVIASISPRDFIDVSMPMPAATDHFRFYSPYVNLTELENAAYTEPFARLNYAMNFLPLKILGSRVFDFCQPPDKSNKPDPDSDLTADINSIKKNVLMAVTMPSLDVAPGEWIVPANMPANCWIDNTREYKQRFKDPRSKNYQAEMAFFKKWLEFMQSSGIKVLVVSMPSMEMNRKLLPDWFWAQYRKDIANTCSNYQAKMIDLSSDPAFTKSDFLDTVHPNAHGGYKLFAKIADAIPPSTFK